MTLCLTLYRVSQICQNLGVRLGGKFRVCLNLLLNYIAADLRPIAWVCQLSKVAKTTPGSVGLYYFLCFFDRL